MKRGNKKALVTITTLLILLTGYFFLAPNLGLKSDNQSNNSEQINNSAAGGLTQKQYDQLAKLNYKSGQNAVYIVNNNNSTLNKKWTKCHIDYQNLDNLNRTSKSVTAYLSQDNIAKQKYRVRQIVKPTGWHSNRPGDEIYNRGHLIAYSLSGGIDKWGKYVGGKGMGDQNNPKNLFTQTAFTNQNVQTYYENQVREAMYSGQKVIYQATPIFRGSEKMARGVNLQAISMDGMINFNVYIFNVQPGFKFDYQTGRAIRDINMKASFNQ